MFDWLRKRPLLDPAASDWLFDAFAWALRTFGSDHFRSATVLVEPSDRHFPDRIKEPGALAMKLFERVRAHAGMQGWPCKLALQEDDPRIHVASTVLIKGAPQGPAGTFRLIASSDGAGRQALITINPKKLHDPEGLIATYAHELAHYLAHSVDAPPPGGEACEELATDVLAIVNGFGLFIANTSFRFQQFQSGTVQGWSVGNQGYLNRFEATYALAIFCALKAIPSRQVERHLQRGLIPIYRRAAREVAAAPALLALRAIESARNPGGMRPFPAAWSAVEVG